MEVRLFCALTSWREFMTRGQGVGGEVGWRRRGREMGVGGKEGEDEDGRGEGGQDEDSHRARGRVGERMS